MIYSCNCIWQIEPKLPAVQYSCSYQTVFYASFDSHISFSCRPTKKPEFLLFYCYCCSITSVPGTVYWEQLEFSLFPIALSRNSALETGTRKLSVLCELFPEQQMRNRNKNLLFPMFCSGNAVPETEEVHQTYLLQFRPAPLFKIARNST